jgi:hypothetical protein
MRSVVRAWPSRLLATALALALTLAYGIAAYAHGAGHQLPPSAVAAAGVDAGHSGDAAAEPGTATPDHSHQQGHSGGCPDRDGTGNAPDCCDMLYHGGQAILAAAPVVPHPLLAAPAIAPAAALHGADPGGLDRPPKPFRSA